VNMPDRDTLLLLVHTRSGNHRLILSCNPSLPRAHITTRKYLNPDVASGTLMYFRKRLAGGVITVISKDKCERMLCLTISARDELLRPVEYKLAVELTGKCANIIFIENGIIGNALRRVTSEAPGKRAVLPGLPYTLPNATGRVSVFDHDEFKARVNALDGVSFGAAVNGCVAGLSKTTVDELIYRLKLTDVKLPADAAVDAFAEAAAKLYENPLTPAVTFDDGGKPIDYFSEPYRSCGGTLKKFDTLNAAMDAYYSALFDVSELALFSKPLKAAVSSAIKKNRKRLSDADAKLVESEGADTDKKLGELITANIYRINRGDEHVTVEDWYDGNAPITIELDVDKTPSQNAAKHYKLYNKKKKAAVYAKSAKDAAIAALDRLEGIATEIELCTTRLELDEVRAELEALGLIRPDSKKKKQKPTPSEPYTFDVLGVPLFVGKNNAQNDRITRDAQKTDVWMHVKDAHGCHAVLKTSSPTDEQLTRAAEIAAFYSSARGADNVAVDYTQIKHVRQKGGGHVEYKEYKTLFVKPKPQA
ncbi:MAG: NFACT RNA binding domain-containing protein, partial [Clostridiales bacterium]|nr:NFACT RNA binding domain-containing protein [Clostridiales bacterium]